MAIRNKLFHGYVPLTGMVLGILGSAAAFASPGFSVTVADDSSTTYKAVATYSGGVSTCSAGFTYVEDSTPPNTTIDSGPSGLTNNASPSFSFSSSQAGSSFECKLDTGSFAACTSPKSYSGLTDGAHSVEVRATDAAGNVDASPASERGAGRENRAIAQDRPLAKDHADVLVGGDQRLYGRRRLFAVGAIVVEELDDSDVALGIAGGQRGLREHRAGVAGEEDVDADAGLGGDLEETYIADPGDVDDDSFAVRQQFLQRPDEGLYGLGQQQDGRVNYAGQNVELTTYNMEISIPFLASTEGYGLLWNNTAITRIGDPGPPRPLSDSFELLDANGDDRDPFFVATQVHTWIHTMVHLCSTTQLAPWPDMDDLLAGCIDALRLGPRTD